MILLDSILWQQYLLALSDNQPGCFVCRFTRCMRQQIEGSSAESFQSCRKKSDRKSTGNNMLELSNVVGVVLLVSVALAALYALFSRRIMSPVHLQMILSQVPSATKTPWTALLLARDFAFLLPKGILRRQLADILTN